MSSCFLPRDASLICGFDSVAGIDDLSSSIFLTCYILDATLGHIPPFRLRCGGPPLICMIIPGYEIHARLTIRFHFVPILRGASLESFSQILTLWYSRGSWTKLCRVSGFPRHHFSGVHIRSFAHPHGIILRLPGQIRYIWCHTGAYFPHLAMEAIVLSHIRYSSHHSVEIYCIHLDDHYS